MLGLCIALPYWVVADSRAEERAEARSAVEAEAREARADARDCDARVTAGSELKATALAGVEHAESTAALMDSIADILEGVIPTSPAVVEIRAEVNRYVAGVAEFRQVAEQYKPTTFAECIARAQAD